MTMLDRNSILLPAAVSLLFLLSVGCSLAPRYTTPGMSVRDSWAKGELDAINTEFNASELDLEVFFRDARLRTVISHALEANRDIRRQVADLDAARATYRIRRADLVPRISADGVATRSQGDVGDPANRFSAELGLSAYELDLFGKNRSLSRAALETYLSSHKAVEAARIGLVAETAGAWISLAANMESLALAKDTADSAKRSLQIAQSRHQSGLVSILDVHRAESTLRQAETDIARYTVAVARDKNALELLTGNVLEQSNLPDGFIDSKTWLGLPTAGMSSDVLLRRPDIAAAEHSLKSANANIGAARAAFFPSISLFASTGRASAELSDLFSSNSNQIWAFTGAINLPIFSGGARMANLRYAEAKYRSQLAQYDKTIQIAFREVADALAMRSSIDVQIEAQNALVELNRQSYDLSQKRYSTGIEAYLSVLQAQRDYYSSRQRLIDITLTELDNRIALYRVLGGGREKHAKK